MKDLMIDVLLKIGLLIVFAIVLFSFVKDCANLKSKYLKESMDAIVEAENQINTEDGTYQK